uniref:One cut domain family member n=2 Tax=Schistocephalus solidus TaxID=70667 RepID=A0A0V0JAT5_SCHSO
MDHRHLLNNSNEILAQGRTVNSNTQKASALDSFYIANPQINPGVITNPLNIKISTEALKMEPTMDAQLAGLQNSQCCPITMAALPISALGTTEKLNLQVGDLENIPLFNNLDGRTLELQTFPGNNQALQGIQTVKLTLINCGDQQTILLTTPSGPFGGLDQSTEGLTITIPENLLTSDLNLSGLSTVPIGTLPVQAEAEIEPPGPSKSVGYTNLTSLPPITSVSDKLYAQKLPSDVPTVQGTTQTYGVPDLASFVATNGEKPRLADKNVSNSKIFPAPTAEFAPSAPLPITISVSNEVPSVSMVEFPRTELKTSRPITPEPASPSSIQGETTSDLDHDATSPSQDATELNTKELAQKISEELKRHSIPQAVFAQKVLCRSQGTLSDLLRNPKPWSKLKSGRETFRRMWKWLNEPDYRKFAFLKSSGRFLVLKSVVAADLDSGNLKRKSGDAKPGEEKASKKPRLVFTDIQRRTLQAIFKETKRPSKEMQTTIAQQLSLEVSTVANFFMNARRRSSDKWQDDDEPQPAESASPSRSIDPPSPSEPSQPAHSALPEPPVLQPAPDVIPPSQIFLECLEPSVPLSSTVEFNPSPAPPRLTPDSGLAVPAPATVHINSGVPSQIVRERPVSGSILVASDGSSVSGISPQLLTHSLQLLPAGQNAILINSPIEGEEDPISIATLPGSSACLISSTGIPVSMISALDSISLPTGLFTSSSSNSAQLIRPSSDGCQTVRIALRAGPVDTSRTVQSQTGSTGLVLPSAATLIANDRSIEAEHQPSSSASDTPVLCRVKPEQTPQATTSSRVGISINPKGK